LNGIKKPLTLLKTDTAMWGGGEGVNQEALLSPFPRFSASPFPALFFPFLAREIFPKFGLRGTNLRFLMKPLSASHRVFCCQEKHSRISVIAKFADEFNTSKPRGLSSLTGEFENLIYLRCLGFDRPPFRVARPLGRENKMGLALVAAAEPGRDLDFFLQKAILEGDLNSLAMRVHQLSSFLAHLHQRTVSLQPRSLQQAGRYVAKVLAQLEGAELLQESERCQFEDVLRDWLTRFQEIGDRQVLIHGDATPTNFIFPSEEEIVAIDLERMKLGDRLWDVGMVCGELKHAFLWRARDDQGSETFIQAFLTGYASHFPRPDSVFRHLCRLLPYYMAITELRIARNDYLDLPYRKLLIEEARSCLSWGLTLQ
jgi:aminoglycoside phosphotransferase